METTTRVWQSGQVRDFARRFLREWGPIWPALVPAVREAAIHAFVLGVVRGQARESVTIASIDELTSSFEAEVARQARRLG